MMVKPETIFVVGDERTLSNTLPSSPAVQQVFRTRAEVARFISREAVELRLENPYFTEWEIGAEIRCVRTIECDLKFCDASSRGSKPRRILTKIRATEVGKYGEVLLDDSSAPTEPISDDLRGACAALRSGV